MKLYLVRHGQTDFNAGNITQGESDIPLNDTGKQQARELAQEIKERNLDFDIYYVSPLQRARQTAEIITDGKAEFIIDNLLKERYFGELEGQKIDDWSKIGDIFDRRVNLSSYGIEPIKTLLARAQIFLDKLATTYPDNVSILVVAHGALLRAIHFNIVGYDDDTDFPAFWFQNCEMREYNLPSKIK